MKDYYRILHITPDATQAEIKKAYRRLAKVHHPDVAATAGAEEEEIDIQDLNEAYSMLGNPERRARYDWTRVNRRSTEQETTEAAAYSAQANTCPTETSNGFLSSIFPKREAVRPYLKYVYPISKIALVFCLLLFVDFLLPLRHRTDKAIYIMRVDANEAGRQQPTYTRIKTWLGRTVQVSKNAAEHFTKNPDMLVYSTPIFAKPRYVAPVSKAENRFLIDQSIYGNFIFLPLILLTIALPATIRRFSPEADFSLGIMSGLLLLVSLGLLMV